MLTSKDSTERFRRSSLITTPSCSKIPTHSTENSWTILFSTIPSACITHSKTNLLQFGLCYNGRRRIPQKYPWSPELGCIIQLLDFGWWPAYFLLGCYWHFEIFFGPMML